MIRVEVSEEGQAALPAFDVDGSFAIGSGEAARVRLPQVAAKPEHVVIEGTKYRSVDGTSGEIGDGVTLTIGAYRVKLSPSPAGAQPTPPQRTESLARELMRNLLGTAGAPTLELVRGPSAGAKRMLAPPESTLVIGRGDEAGWIIDDKDLSREHCEVRRGWDGTRIVDRDSKNGTKVDGEPIDGEVTIYDGATIELGKVVLTFRDPVAKRPASLAKRVVETKPKPSTLPFYAAIAIMLAAFAGLIWIVSS